MWDGCNIHVVMLVAIVVLGVVVMKNHMWIMLDNIHYSNEHFMGVESTDAELVICRVD